MEWVGMILLQGMILIPIFILLVKFATKEAIKEVLVELKEDGFFDHKD